MHNADNPMRNAFAVACALGLLCAAPARAADNWAMIKPVTMTELQKDFAQPDMAYAPFAFWFWDAPLEPQQVAAMAAEMCRQGFNPGYAHGRTGLPPEQWLSPLWFESIDAALRQTEAAHAYMGYCDEYNWPGGQVAGRMLKAHPELQAMSLKWDMVDVAGGQETKLPTSFFTVAAEVADGKLIKSASLQVIGAGEAFSWRAPQGQWRVYSFNTYPHAGIDGSPICYLNERLPELVIQMVHQPYIERFGQRLGKNMSGVFMDHEGDYGWKLAWSDTLDRVYKERTGRDIRLWMPLMIQRDTEGLWAKARWDWLDVVSDIYADGFFGQISRWVEQHNLYVTSHVWEETLQLQAEAVGDFFKFQRAITMPGTDSLVSKPLEVLEFKETQSVAEFEGRRCTSEILGVAGWKMTPVLLKQAANAVTAWGVNHMIPHGVFNNRNLNAIPYPPDFYVENPYWRYFHLWTDFARRASYVNSQGHIVPDVLLVNPMDSVWALTGEWLFVPQPDVAKQVEQINTVYRDAVTRLTAARVEFLIGDRHYIRKMTVGDGRLTIGDFDFRALVLPPMTILPLDVAEKIVAFAKAGGPVYTLGDLPSGSTEKGMADPAIGELMTTLRGLPTVTACTQGLAAELARPNTRLASQAVFESGAFDMLELHRRIDGRDFFWLANNSARQQQCKLSIHNIKGAASVWDCETGQIHALGSEDTADGAKVALTFRPYEAYWLVFDPTAPAKSPVPESPAPPAAVIKLDGPWQVRIDPAVQPSLSTGVAKFFTVPWRAAWLRAGEQSQFRYTFNLPAEPAHAQIDVTADAALHLWVNGEAVPRHSWDDLWQQVSLIDATRALKSGRNVIAVQAGKPGGQGGVILQGQVKLRDGKSVALTSGDSWRCVESAPMARKWIWHPTAKGNNQTVFLRRACDIDRGAQITSAALDISADNEFVLYVNGRKIGAHDNWAELRTYDVASALQGGRNVIAIEAKNEAGPCGVLLGLNLQFADGTTKEILSDEQWLASDKREEDWTAAGFDDAKWVKVAVVGNYGDAPWGRLAGETPLATPAWARSDFEARSWKPAEALGVPPLAPWIDVPAELLATGGVTRPLESWLTWGLSRFTGYVDYTTAFDLKDPVAGRVVLDLGQVKHMAEVYVVPS